MFGIKQIYKKIECGNYNNEFFLSVKDSRLHAEAVTETENELKRCRGFKPIFPSINYHYYKLFFKESRSLNHVVYTNIIYKQRLTENTVQIKSKRSHSQFNLLVTIPKDSNDH